VTTIMFHNGSFYMFGMHGLWWVFWIAVVVALVYSVTTRSGWHRRQPRETSHEVLQRRLANGEIDVQQYEERKAILDRDAGATRMGD
jgi:putative membrane protein